jgi:hypothetical protein
MSRYFAAVDNNNIVQRVIVAHSQEWCEQTLGGTWIETVDPYSDEPQEITYCGPGYGCDTSFPERFAPPWVMPAPDPETGVWSSYPKGTLAYHEGHLWRSTTDGNVWEPGISAWHPESEIEGILPAWIQPTGAHDSYPMGFEVAHDGQDWYVTAVDANGHNVWEPGVFGWTVVGQEPEPGEDWVDTGVTIAQLVGAGVYRVSAVVSGLTLGQALKLGTAETVFDGFWPTTGTPSDYIKITPHVSAAVGSTVWKWA